MSPDRDASVRDGNPREEGPLAERPRPRADCTVDGENRLTIRLTAPATPTAQAPASRPQLLLRLRPPKGQPEQVRRVFDLEPAPGQDRWQATIEPSPAFTEGRWDAYVLPAPGEPRRRLLPGVRDLRALVTGRAPDRTSSPLAVRIPYATLDGYFAVRAWLRPRHAEADRIHVADGAMTVRGRLFGAELDTGAAALLRRRGTGGTVREVELTARGDHVFSFTAGYRDLLSTPGAGPGVWDVFVRPSADAPRIRLARLLDDLADRKKVFVYPATALDGLNVRPYYTVDNDLSVEITAA
ncbi:hypothetical protein [Streptomyces scopuliridis]|uniref:Transferase n=1 Tax=Streptomyces scopuliridis RB72 TaxID=1440053 RepID=A0A2T7TEJ2_9ACTN|nr:hypothetical protein [Streptomyces scopuliridis]PVE13575.1 hypothetical protein Y717_16715 [Streptomyces scopuliridis RB72]